MNFFNIKVDALDIHVTWILVQELHQVKIDDMDINETRISTQ